MNKPLRRIVSATLALSLSVTLAVNAYAEEIEKAHKHGATNSQAAPKEPKENKKPEKTPITKDNLPEVLDFDRVKEQGFVSRLKSEETDMCEIVLENEDGTRGLYVFDSPVKFKNEKGEIVDKSNKVKPHNKNGAVGFRSESNDIDVNLPVALQAGISLKDEEVNVSMKPLPSAVSKRPLSAGKQKDEDSVIYEDVFDNNTDIVYTFTYDGVKEDIVLEKYNGKNTFDFEVITGGLSLEEEKGALLLKDENGEVKATMGEIVIFSADNKNNTFGKYKITEKQKNNSYIITVCVDVAYLTSPDTKYPVTIDPSINSVKDDCGIEDMQVFKGVDGTGKNETSAGLSGVSRVGWTDWGACRTLMKMTSTTFTNEVQSSDQIVSAYVEMRDLMCQGISSRVACSMFTGNNWDETVITTWNQIKADSLTMTISPPNTVSYGKGTSLRNLTDSSQWYNWNIKSIVEKWADDHSKIDKGLIFRMYETSMEKSSYASNMKTFSSMQGNSIYKPYIYIKYKYRAVYNAITVLGQEDKAVATETVDLLENMGYPTDYAELPSFNDIKRTANSASILIIHGHGERGRILIRTSPTEESYISVWSESLEQIPSSTWDHITFVFFATCYSGKSYGCSKSMVDKAYELGADYVIGFNNTVSGAEDFLNFMIEAIESSDTPITLHMAKEYAVSQYKDITDPSCPANITNLCVRGSGRQYI